jgi:Ca2+-binding RTX toxin-like protein
MAGGAGADVFVIPASASTLAAPDTIVDFSGTGGQLDTIKTGTAGTAANYIEAGAVADFAAAQAAADTAMNGTVIYYLTSTAADGGLLFIDGGIADGTADAVIKLTGITSANFAFGDIVA